MTCWHGCGPVRGRASSTRRGPDSAMQRIRTVKPEFFQHEGLFDLEMQVGLPVRLAFVGLWTCCDREGRFPWRPRKLKTDILPYDDLDFAAVLDALAGGGFLQPHPPNR